MVCIDSCMRGQHSHYYTKNGTPDYEKFPALKLAEGFDFTLEPGDTLFMPAGYWHHMEYLDSGFAMSLRALQPSLAGKLKGMWSLIGMRGIDSMMKKTAPKWWYEKKKKKLFAQADKELKAAIT